MFASPLGFQCMPGNILFSNTIKLSLVVKGLNVTHTALKTLNSCQGEGIL